MTPGYDIIIYCGQSNTCGRGIGPFTESDASNDGVVFQIGRAPGVNMTVIPITDPLQGFWYYATPYHGYGATFARLYAAQFLKCGRKVLLICAAQGGTSILQWLGLIAGTGDDLYGDMAARIAYALGLPGGTNRIVAWVENQGETDVVLAASPADPNHALMPDANTYLARKLDLIAKARADFGTFPMVFGGFCQAFVRSNTLKLAFQAAIRTSAQQFLCGYTDTTGLQSNADIDPSEGAVHFSASGQEGLALAHFATYSAINYVQNASFDTWSDGSTITINKNAVTPVADHWTCYRPNVGEVTISQQVCDTVPYCMRLQRNVGTTHQIFVQSFQQLPSEIVQQLSGRLITVLFRAKSGMDFSANNGHFRVTVYTGSGIDETFDESALAFPTGPAASADLFVNPTGAWQNYCVKYNVPDAATEMVLRLSYSPVGTAGAADYVDVSDVILSI